MTSSLEFDKLVRMVQRQQNVSEPVPPFFIRTLVTLESSLNSAVAKEKEAKKKMNASNARALTAMKQKVKKVAKEHENEIKQYHAVSRISSLYNHRITSHMYQDPERFEQEYASHAAAEAQPPPPKVKKVKRLVGETDEEDEEFTTVGKGGKAMAFTPESIFKNLQLVQEARGKKVCHYGAYWHHLIFILCFRTPTVQSKFAFWRSSWKLRLQTINEFGFFWLWSHVASTTIPPCLLICPSTSGSQPNEKSIN